MINCIVAVEKNQGIGIKGQLPWPHLSGDMNWFKGITTNHVVIMGAITFKSLRKPLPNRVNIVISNQKNINADHVFSDIKIALDTCASTYPTKEIFIIGGTSIYEQYKGYIDRYYITEIDARYICDKFFDLKYVRDNYTNVKTHMSFFDQQHYIEYTIKEYTK